MARLSENLVRLPADGAFSIHPWNVRLEEDFVVNACYFVKIVYVTTDSDAKMLMRGLIAHVHTIRKPDCAAPPIISLGVCDGLRARWLVADVMDRS